MDYNVDYYIEKFEAIPEEKWTTGVYHNPDTDRCCALGHLGMRSRNSHTLLEEHTYLIDLIMSLGTTNVNYIFRGDKKIPQSCLIPFNVAGINDGAFQEYQQPTPKQRILAALYDIKDQQQQQQAVEEVQSILENPVNNLVNA